MDQSRYESRTIRINQISNIDDMTNKVLFRSPAEKEDIEFLSGLSKWNSGAAYHILAIDITPEEPDPDRKQYEVLYGQKKVYAALKLGMDRIEIKAFSETVQRNIDRNVYRAFFNADFFSLTSFEKGKFLVSLMDLMDMKIAEVSQKAGLSCNTLQSLISAYQYATQNTYPSLEQAYKDSLISQLIINRGQRIYKMIPDAGLQDEITEYLIRTKNIGLVELEHLLVKDPTGKAEEIIRHYFTDLKKQKELPPVETKEEQENRALADYFASKGHEIGIDAISSDAVAKERSKAAAWLKNCQTAYETLIKVIPDNLYLSFLAANAIETPGDVIYAGIPKIYRSIKYQGQPVKKYFGEGTKMMRMRLFCRIINFTEAALGRETAPVQIVEAAMPLILDEKISAAFRDFFDKKNRLENYAGKLLKAIESIQ